MKMKSQNNKKEVSQQSLGAVHTHTHTSTFRKIKRVANEATLFGVKNRLCVVLYLGKNVVLEIACFFRALKIMLERIFLLQQNYENYKEFLCNCYCLEILVMCFSCCLKINFITELTNLKILNKVEIQGGVA